jgi:tetratricopeptide (TPR) repeat protein
MTGDVLGTLRYMSPEQALAKHGLVDHRTDVYSLGATLYELLTGRPAVEGQDRQEILKRIADEESRPPRALDRAIPADLETIVLKALAKEPSERYATAKDLADDLRRFLQDKPIEARRPSLAQRGRKWFRRHPSVIRVAVGALLLGAAGSAVSTLLVYQEQRRTQTAYEQVADEQRRTRAAYEKVVASRKQIDRVLSGFDYWAMREGPLAPKSVDAKSRSLAATLVKEYEGIAALDGDDEETQAIVAKAHMKVGSLRRKMGQPAEAEKAYRRGIEVYQSLQTANPTELLYRRGVFGGWNNMGEMFRDFGLLEEAEDALRTAVNLQRRLVADYPEDCGAQGTLCWALRNLGLTLRDRGRLGAARQCFDEANRVMQAARKLSPEEKNLQGLLVVLPLNLADTLLALGEHAEAANTAAQAAQFCDKQGDEYLAVARMLFCCRFAVEKDARLKDRERKALIQGYVGRAMAVLQALLEKGRNHPQAQHAVARFLLVEGAVRPEDSRQAYEMAEQVAKRSPTVGIAWNTLGMARYRAGKFEAAIEALEQSRRLRDRGDSFDFFFLAMAHWQLRNEDEARKWYDQAVQWMEKNQRPDDELPRFRAEAAALLGINDAPLRRKEGPSR